MALNLNIKAFFKANMTSESDQSKVQTGRFYDNTNTAAVCAHGDLVVIGTLDAHKWDNYAITDMNVRKLTHPAAITDRVAIVDFDGTPFATNGELFYGIGYRTIGQPPKAGETTKVRVFEIGDTFYLADGNFAAPPVLEEYAAPTAGAGTWTPAAAQVAGATNIRIEPITRPLTVGTVDEGTWYLCTVVSLAA